MRLASRHEDGALGQVSIKILAEPSTKESINHIMSFDPSPSWIDPIFEFIAEETTLKDKNEVRRIRYQSNRYVILNGKLYRRGYAMPYFKCLRLDEAEYVMRKIHKGFCGNHSRKRSLMQKALRQGYYWPTIQKDSTDLVWRCDKCHRFTHVPRQPL